MFSKGDFLLQDGGGNLIMSGLEYFLMIFGIASIVTIILAIFIFLYDFAKDVIRDLKWLYKRKHRFDKPPTAQCYCNDCKYYKPYSSNRGQCGRGHIETWSVSDNSFCWQAEPLKSDPEDK